LVPEPVEAFRNHREKHGIRPGVAGSEHQAAKAVIALKSLATFLAVRRLWHDELDQSVLKPVAIPLSDAERKRLSVEDFSHVLAAAEEGPFPQRDRTILFLLAGNGPREKELVSLQLQHYDRAESTITIPARGTKGRRGYRRARPIYIDEIVRPELDRYIDEHRAGLDNPEAPLFTTRSGSPFTENGLYQVLHRLKVATGIKALCPHALRHYWAEHFEGDLLELKQEGGWNSWKLVERYRKPTRPTRRKSTLADALAPRSKRMSPRHISASRKPWRKPV
jgi:integrase